MTLPWLDIDTPFPPVDQALEDPPGLLAAGRDLRVHRLIDAYRSGVFPWFGEGEPILWWSPDPRMVLACTDFSPGRALRKRLRQVERGDAGDIVVRVDTAFTDVMAACAAPRDGQPGTWITAPMQQAYTDWHRAGGAHSIETWIDGQLAGGLYGVSLGEMFFGESMFTRVTDASKIALAHLVAFLKRYGVTWIDCQQQTRHLASLGAAPVPRADFIAHVQRTYTRPAPPWTAGVLLLTGEIVPDTPASSFGVTM
ncbi:MAG: leucyl/phenylalanyl-tRNA--protein transferase [Burkholderiaceae bacterium]|nr:leucyl/phenylalanyl-tRNA--protein transferase [Burkholderiaceae bacterium]